MYEVGFYVSFPHILSFWLTLSASLLPLPPCLCPLLLPCACLSQVFYCPLPPSPQQWSLSNSLASEVTPRLTYTSKIWKPGSAAEWKHGVCLSELGYLLLQFHPFPCRFPNLVLRALIHYPLISWWHPVGFHLTSILSRAAVNMDVEVSVVGSGILGAHPQEWYGWVIW